MVNKSLKVPPGGAAANVLAALVDEEKRRRERLQAAMKTLQENLDNLRLSIKYLVFDLEATRRENGYLRKMLQEQTGE